MRKISTHNVRYSTNRGAGVKIIRLLSAQALLLVSTLAGAACVPVPSGAVAWWRAENNFKDSIGNNDGTPSTALITFGPGEVGNAFVLPNPGTDPDVCQIRVPNADALNPTQAITIEGWVMISDLDQPDNFMRILEKEDGQCGPCSGQYGIGAYINESGTWLFYAQVGLGCADYLFIDSPSLGHLVTGTWYYVAMTYDVSDGYLRLYVNGLQVSCGTSSQHPGGPIVQTTGDLLIGSLTCPSWVAQQLHGSIDEFAVYNRALTASEILSIYNAGSAGKCLVPPPPPCAQTPPNLVAWWKAENSTVDAVCGQTASWVNQSAAYLPGIVGQAFSFQNGYLTTPGSSSLDVGLGSGFTIEGWVKPAPPAGGPCSQSQTLAVTYPVVSWLNGPSLSIEFLYTCSAGQFALAGEGALNIKLGTSQIFGAANVITPNRFQHIAVTYDKTSGVVMLLVNGQVVLQQQVGQLAVATASDLYIGYDGANTFNQGLIDEVSIYSSALSSGTIGAIYNAGANGKCIVPPCPTCPSQSPGLVSWWRAEGDAKDTTGNNNGVLLNSATFACGKFGQAFSFDVTGGTVEVQASCSLNVGASSGLTLEAWVDPSDISSGCPVVEWNNLSATSYGSHFWVGHPSHAPGYMFANIVDIQGNWHVIDSADGVVQANVFQHIAVTYNQTTGNAALYRNGQLLKQINLGIFTPQTTYPLFIGERPSTDVNQPVYVFRGLIDEIKIYNIVRTSAQIASDAQACVPPPQGIVSWWRAEGDATDAMGNNNGTFMSTPTFNAGEVGQAFNFDGYDDTVVIENPQGLDVGQGPGFTVETWINPRTLGGPDEGTGHPVIEWNDGGPYAYGTHIWVGHPSMPAGNFFANIHDLDGADHVINTASGLLQANSWQHIAITYDETSGDAYLYLNGTAVAYQNLGIFTPQTSYSLYLGERPNSGYVFNGLIDEPSIYSRVLSQCEIQQIYLAGASGKCPP